MKLLIILFVIVALVAAETPEEKAKKVHDECIKESGVSEDTLSKARSNQPVDDPKLKENAFCLYKKSGIVSESGDINTDVLKNDIKQNGHTEEEANNLVTKCAVKKDTPQNTAYDLTKCLHDAGH